MIDNIIVQEQAVNNKSELEQNIETERRLPLNCLELLREFEKKPPLPEGIKLNFSGVDGKDVYNISKPFSIGSETVISGRVEGREVGSASEVRFFSDKNGKLIPAEGAPVLPLEDGFAAKIGKETIIGGVEVYPNPTTEQPQRIDYRTVFYRGRDFSELKKFALGPELMKDIRLAELADNRVATFTRPQGGDNGPGRIAYVELNSINDLNAQNLRRAEVIANQFTPEEWGGANELHLLPDGRIGVLGHIAYRDAENCRHYYAMSFIYNPKTQQATPIEIIATRKNFPAGEAKNYDLEDVIFPGGLVRHGDGTATLYAGLSDVEAGCVQLPDPFKEKNIEYHDWSEN